MKEIKELLSITQKLRDKYNGKQFTLDGKLVGDIGEVLAAQKYGLELYGENEPVHDGYEISTGRKVQIKSSFKGNSYFPYKQVPEFFLSLIITEDGKLEELFNGPGQFIVDHYIKTNNLKGFRKNYYTLAPGILRKLNTDVPQKEKINIL
ncbi:hypothetical protein [Reichenbachiella sp.]|uniref:DUF6998 domain-containing protein n=1 Tax=Reichenbachiella sp. TaxID=2184521 RepID=UPI0032988FB1